MEGQNTIIPIQGIVRNTTKLKIQDGQAEDIINLRFCDGAWRASGDGKLVFQMGGVPGEVPYVDTQYRNIFIHTNVYRHVIGVSDSSLWWFADVTTDGVFVPLGERIELCSIDIREDVFSYTPVGNLVTVIETHMGGVHYIFFDEISGKYKAVDIDENKAPNSRELYPYGQVHLNLDMSETEDTSIDVESEGGDVAINNWDDIDYSKTSAVYYTPDRWHADMLEAYRKAQEKNLFTRPFMTMVAVKLYDGTYAFASSPTLLWPREKLGSGDEYYTRSVSGEGFNIRPENLVCAYTHKLGKYVNESFGIFNGEIIGKIENDEYKPLDTNFINVPTSPCYQSGSYCKDLGFTGGTIIDIKKGSSIFTRLNGARLLLSIESIDLIRNNPEIFTGIGIFITPEVDIYDVRTEKEHYGHVAYDFSRGNFGVTVNFSYVPKQRDKKEIINDLTTYPFYLLRDYTLDELGALSNNITVDLTDAKYNAILKNITSSYRFRSESVDRRSFTPKCAYGYNGRLHLANYKSTMFYGFPIDTLLYNNKSGVNNEASDYNVKNFKEVEGDLREKYETMVYNSYNLYQYDKKIYPFVTDSALHLYEPFVGLLASYLLVKVYLRTNSSEPIVSRFIRSYVDDGIGNFYIEDLPPFLCFPDNRAYKMEIVFSQISANGEDVYLKQYRREFDLKRHNYLNMSYFVDEDIHPIKIDGFECIESHFETISILGIPEILNATESFPNGIKVSATNNPIVFPYKNTYQVGSSEIISICSNAVAVGTGQTGSAPLYVLCKDGVYALMVDASGEMVYTNSRIISRDVCNNKASVTPIDGGVAFTTDRGLMIISGSEVQELSESVEGKPLNYIGIRPSLFTPLGFGINVLTKMAKIDTRICDGRDFVEFTKSAIICYNHNLRELLLSDNRTEHNVDTSQTPSDSPIRDTDMARVIIPRPQLESRYTYVMDRNGMWSRRNNAADEYVNNYPTAYRILDGKFYQVDEEEGGRNESDNTIFYLSNVIKLGSVGFKQAYRLVVRGYFETLQTGMSDEYIGLYVFGSYDGRMFSLLGGNEKSGAFTDLGCKVERTDVRYFRICLAGVVTKDTRIDWIEMSSDISKILHNSNSNKIR